MKKRRFAGGYTTEAAVAVTALLSILLVALIHSNPGFNRYADAATPFFLLQPVSVEEETIPDYAGVRRTYTFSLPDADSATTTGARISFYLRHTIASFSIEGSALENDLSENDTPHIGKTPGNYWVNIPMRPVFAGKTLQVTLTPVYESVRDDEPTFFVIPRDMLLTMLVLPEDGLLLVLSAAAIGAGLFLALIALALPMDKQDKKRVFYLGALTAAAGLWKLCGLPALTLLLDHWGLQKEIWFAGAVSYLLMLVLSLRLLILLRKKDRSSAGMACFYLAAATTVLLLLLQICNVLELHPFLIWYGVGAAALHVISLLDGKPGPSDLLWVLPFFLALGADLMIRHITGSTEKASVFLLWILMNLFVRGLGFVRMSILREHLLQKQEEELRDAKLKSLMNQIRPHFIYNTLASVYELCRDEPRRAMEVIDDFTTYLQSNYSAIAATEPVSFREELAHTRAYLAVESMLFGEELTVAYETGFTDFCLPPLTLQPIVENAVKYGVGQGHRPEHIIIRTVEGTDGIRVVIEDNGVGYDPSTDGSVHVGLQNVRERLEMMCGGSLKIGPRPDGGTVVTVWLPSASQR